MRQLTPSFRRITFTGADLDELAPTGADQRIKVLLPLDGLPLSHCPTGAGWYAGWRALPRHRRHPMRTYTLRAARPLQREVDVDFVLHGATGPASSWAESAAVGDEVVLVGPNARFDGPAGGSQWRPPASARALLVAGDETAVPAISAIAEDLPAGSGAQMVLEVPTEADVLALDVPADVRVTWLPWRVGTSARPRGALLTEAVCAAADALGAGTARAATTELTSDELVWEVPDDVPATTDAYAWLAGEAGVITGLRRYLLRKAGFDRRSVAFMGYWRQGRSES